MLQDNAPAHENSVVMMKAVKCGFDLLPQAPYSRGLASSDYHLFPHMKKFLLGRTFSDEEEANDGVIQVREGFQPTSFARGLWP